MRKLLLIPIVIAILFAVTAIAQSDPWTIDGNKVYVNDSKAYISAEPHTITQSGYVEYELISKVYDGPVNVIYGFNSDNSLPKSIEYFSPHNVSIPMEYTCEGPGIYYTYTTNPKHLKCWKNQSTNGNQMFQSCHFLYLGNDLLDL